MSTRPMGNGSGKVNIGVRDMGGWLRVFVDRTAEMPDELTWWLSLAVTQWFRERPHLRMRTVVPITRDGATVELHAWHDLGVFADASGQPPPQVLGPG